MTRRPVSAATPSAGNAVAEGPASGGTTPVRCRPIDAADIPAVIDLLVKSFPERPRLDWSRGIARYLAIDPDRNASRLGVLLTVGPDVVGVLLTLYARHAEGPPPVERCGLSSWCVEPYYTAFATMLERKATRQPDVTYYNMSAVRRTWPILKARGYTVYARGQFVAFPLLSRIRVGASVRRVAAADVMDDVTPDDRRLLADHAAYGCLCLIGRDRDGSAPFVFIRRAMPVSGAGRGGTDRPISSSSIVATPRASRASPMPWGAICC